jgi:hypothetical protein
MAEFDLVEQWFQAVITHRGGAGEGALSDEAQKLIPMQRDELEKVICRSNNLSAEDRISIYANAFYARLLECLGECVPVLKRTVGDDVFNEFAFGYLQNYPSRSYTLNHLGDHFAQHLRETKPDDEQATWPDLLIDLAEMEWAIAQVFDGRGIENEPVLSAQDLQSIAPDQWPRTRLVLSPCVRLLCFSYPINTYYSAVRRAAEDEDVAIPEAKAQWIALSRRDYVVQRYELSLPQYELLDALAGSNTIEDAIKRAGESTDMSDDQLAQSLQQWFTQWTADGFFAAVELA